MDKCHSFGLGLSFTSLFASLVAVEAEAAAAGTAVGAAEGVPWAGLGLATSSDVSIG